MNKQRNLYQRIKRLIQIVQEIKTNPIKLRKIYIQNFPLAGPKFIRTKRPWCIHLDGHLPPILFIKGFKSIKKIEDFELKKLNVMIGGNGAGKSNFIDIFRLFRAMMELSLPGLKNVNLQSFVKDGGGIHDFLFNGPKVTEEIELKVLFKTIGYQFKLSPTADESVLIYDEKTYNKHLNECWKNFGGGYDISKLLKEKDDNPENDSQNDANQIYEAIQSWHIYHFNDSSKRAAMRHFEIIEDYDYLRYGVYT